MRFLPAGPTSLLVELASPGAVLALAAEIERRRAGGWATEVADVVPGATTLLLDGVADPWALAAELESWDPPPVTAGTRPVVEVPCRYGGPDLAFVAAHWGVHEDDVPTVHSGLAHRVAFCGFAPGFAYIAGLGSRGGVPRLRSPRTEVPAGSVAVAGDFTGIYPRPSPGGWRIIGSTDVVLWDLERPDPALLRPGATVRFTIT